MREIPLVLLTTSTSQNGQYWIDYAKRKGIRQRINYHTYMLEISEKDIKDNWRTN